MARRHSADKTWRERAQRLGLATWATARRIENLGEYAESGRYNVWLSTPANPSRRLAGGDSLRAIQDVARYLLDDPRPPVGSILQIAEETSGYWPKPGGGDSETWTAKQILQSWLKVAPSTSSATYRASGAWIDNPSDVGRVWHNGREQSGRASIPTPYERM